MPKASAPDLLERLREVYADDDGNLLSDEKLAGKLPISLSTFNRWKKGDTKAFRDVIAMLDKAGWLSTDGAERVRESSPDPLVVIAEGVTELLEQQAELLRRTPAQTAPRKSRSGAAAKRRATGR